MQSVSKLPLLLNETFFLILLIYGILTIANSKANLYLTFKRFVSFLSLIILSKTARLISILSRLLII